MISHSLKLHQFKNTHDRRLGRHVNHDSRSLRFLARAADPVTLQSIQHVINIPIMDQDDLGSCTGHAGTNALASGVVWTQAGASVLKNDAEAAHAYAVDLYSQATTVDPWPGQYMPDDTGSDGLSVAKVLLARGLIAGYQHATSRDAVLTALSKQVVMVGTSWLANMSDPDSTGKLNVSGKVAGGHEYVLDELDVERERVWMRNQWGSTWGIKGRAWMSWDDLSKLLDDDGDCTVLVARSQTAPVPAPAPVPATDATLAKALTTYLHTSTGPAYLRKAGTAWLDAFNKRG